MPYPQEPETLGDHLKKRRYDLSLFQKDVALRLSVNDWTICNWENNKTTPAIRYLPRIIKFLDYDPHPTANSLGERIVTRRRTLGISRKRLARQLGVDEASLRRWECDTCRPSGRRLQLIESFFHTSF